VFDRFWRADPSRDRRIPRHWTRPVDQPRGRALQAAGCTRGGVPGWAQQFAAHPFWPVHSGAPLVSSPLPIEPSDAIPRLAAGVPAVGWDGAR